MKLGQHSLSEGVYSIVLGIAVWHAALSEKPYRSEAHESYELTITASVRPELNCSGVNNFTGPSEQIVSRFS